MKRLACTLAFLAVVPALMSCGPSTSSPKSSIAKTSTVNRAAEIFARACVDEAPNFEGSEALFRSAGIPSLNEGRFPANVDMVGSVRVRNGKNLCGVNIAGAGEAAATIAARDVLAKRDIPVSSEKLNTGKYAYKSQLEIQGRRHGIYVTNGLKISDVRLTGIFLASIDIPGITSSDDNSTPQAVTQSRSPQIKGAFGNVIAEFDEICAGNLLNASKAMRVARGKNYKPFLIPGFLQNNNEGFHALVIGSGSDFVCQVMDTTVADDIAAEAALISYLSRKYPTFDPTRTRVPNAKAKNANKVYVVDVGGESFGFYIGSEIKEGRAKKKTTAIGVNVVK